MVYSNLSSLDSSLDKTTSASVNDTMAPIHADSSVLNPAMHIDTAVQDEGRQQDNAVHG